MADQGDVRRIALSLPEVSEAGDRFAFSVRHGSKAKSLVWAWNERIEEGRPRVAREDVIAVQVPDRRDKEALIDSDGDVFFTEPHYDGFPAVLVRLPGLPNAMLEELIVDAWRVQAPRLLVRAFEAARGG